MSEWRRELVEILSQDHRDIEDLCAQVEATICLQTKAELLDLVTIKLVRHATAEEQWLYPVVRDIIGPDRAKQGIAEHADIQRRLDDLKGMTPGQPGYSRMVTALISDVRAHVRAEEKQLFPQLIAAATPARRHSR